MTTTIGNLVFRAAAGILGAPTCAVLAAQEVNNTHQFTSKS